MSGRVRIAVCGFLCGIVLLTFSAGLSWGEPGNPNEVREATLQEQLEKGLKARRPVEFQFVARVALLVKQGRLTREVVLGSFNFVRKKYTDRKYLVPIFEQVLRKRAAQDGNTALNPVPTTLTIVQP